MTAATAISGKKILILLGNAADPEVFAAPCGTTTKTFGITKAMAESLVPDCSDPEIVGWIEREPTSKSSDISGSGIVSTEAFPTWQAFALSDASKNVRIAIGDLGHFGGAYHCTSLRFTGTQQGKSTFDFSLVSDGAVAWTAAV